jgi:hypothetical protein
MINNDDRRKWMKFRGDTNHIGKMAVLLLMTCVYLLTGCKGKEELSFSALLNNESIQKVQFRNGGTGVLFQTEDKGKIKKLEDFLNTKKYQQAKTPEPYTGYLYAGKLNDKTNIGFAMDLFNLGNKHYKIISGDEEFYSSLNKIVESFGASKN